MAPVNYVALAWSTCVIALVAFAAYAIWRYTQRLLALKHDATAEEFITARGTQVGRRGQ